MVTESDNDILVSVRQELRDAREEHPTNEDQLAALSEELGELCKALLHHKHEDGSEDEVRKEAIQVAAMAVRVATEGDHSYPYVPHRASPSEHEDGEPYNAVLTVLD